MVVTRREFLKGVGVTMASLSMTGCSPGMGRDSSDDSPQGRLRSCWGRLDNLAETTKKDYEKGEQLKAELAAGHRAALDDLVSSGELTALVSDQVQAAFDEALYHVWRANAPMTCYEPMIVEGESIEVVETRRPWFDLGTPASFLSGVCEWAQRRGPLRIPGANWVASDAVVARDASLRCAVVELNSSVAKGSRLERAIVLSDARVGPGCRLRDCIVGPGVELPSGTAVERRLVTLARSDQPPGERDSLVGGLVYSPIS